MSLSSTLRLITRDIAKLGFVKNQFLCFNKVLRCQQRNLNVQEHVSYTLLNKAGIPTPKFGVAKSGKEAKEIAAKLKTRNIVLKAQVLAGGRGVGTFKNGLKGGVRMVSTPEQAEQIANKMVGQYLVTKQTGEAGRICNSVMVAERKFPRRELYIAVMMERAFNGPVIIASAEGGVNIEDVAAANPDAITYVPIDITQGVQDAQIDEVVSVLGLCDHYEETAKLIKNMYCLFIEKDALLIEINPYAEDAIDECTFFALDAKFRFDDSAEYRQKELFALRDLSQEDEREVLASKYNLNYIALDGTIGCMVNGAGLAMATMDIIKLYGGDPANFLDVGGNATKETVTEAFKIIISDPNVLTILVNIFGGIMRCDVIAEGIVAAAKELQMSIPVVVRLQGTNVEQANEIIRKSGMKIITRSKLDDAADVAIHLAEIVKIARTVDIEVSFEEKKKKPKDTKGPSAPPKSAAPPPPPPKAAASGAKPAPAAKPAPPPAPKPAASSQLNAKLVAADARKASTKSFTKPPQIPPKPQSKPAAPQPPKAKDNKSKPKK